MLGDCASVHFDEVDELFAVDFVATIHEIEEGRFDHGLDLLAALPVATARFTGPPHLAGAERARVVRYVDGMVEPDIERLGRLEVAQDELQAERNRPAAAPQPLGHEGVLVDAKLHHVDERVGVAAEHARAGCPVLGVLAALTALGVVVAVGNRAIQPLDEPVELRTEAHYCVGVVLGAGLDLVGGVDDDEVERAPAVRADQWTITVTQTLAKEGEVKDPKTHSGKRTISIDEKTVAHLKAWRKRQREELAKLCMEPGGTTPVCCNERGEWVNLANFERWWRGFRTQAGFPELRFHELRHSQATLLLANGTDLKTVQDRMGHANGAITLNWYAHSVPENDAKAAQLVGDLYGSDYEHEPAKKRKTA